MSFFAELKRRNVFRVGLAYAVAAWLLIQVTDIVFPRIGLPDSAVTLVIALLGIGFIPALVFAWAFELTPEGIKREGDVDRAESITHRTGKKLDRVIIAALGLVVAWFLFDEFYLEPRENPPEVSTPVAEAASEGGVQSVAVLPFVAMSRGEDDEYFADGLTEEILNSLAGLKELLVTARTSSFFFKGKDLPIPDIAAQLGVDHVVEGSVRRAGNKVRVTAQLVRASDGFHLWSQTYDRTLEDVFAVQEDIAANIAAKLDVVLNDEKRARMRQAGIGDVDAFIAFQKGMEAFKAAHNVSEPVDELPEANRWFDMALARVPDIVDALYLRTDLYGHILVQHSGGVERFSREDAERALAEIQSTLPRAIRAAGNEPLRAILAAELQMFSDDWTGIQRHLDKAFELGHCNPLNWIGALAVPFGRADLVARQQNERGRCDPLANTPVWTEVQAMVWDGQDEAAMAKAEAYLSDVGFTPWVDDLRFMALQATGRWADDPGFFGPTPEGSLYRLPRTVFAYAIKGDVARAREIYDAWPNAAQTDAFIKIMAMAAMGDRAEANRLASGVDARLGRNLELSLAVQNCYCGAPFDLDATPNYRARIAESGLPWPPPVRIVYPAKDW